MSKIKIIKGLKPWEVMKRASEGDPVAIKMSHSTESFRECTFTPKFNWDKCTYAIIDTAAPEIDWSKFDFGLFNPYGGVPIKEMLPLVGNSYDTIKAPPSFAADFELRESPFYYWPGGDTAPVPSNVEVELILRDGLPPKAMAAGIIKDWAYGFNNSERGSGDIIAFRITGNVL